LSKVPTQWDGDMQQDFNATGKLGLSLKYK